MLAGEFSLKNPIIKYGLLGSVIYVLFTFSLYLAGVSALMSLWRLVPLVIAVLLAIYAAQERRALQNNIISFSEVVVTVLLTFVMIEFIWGVFYFLLFNVFDPNLSEATKLYSLDRTYELHQKSGATPEEIEKKIVFIKEHDFRVTHKVFFFNLLLWSCFGFLIALLSGAILKKESHQFNRDLN